MKRYGTGKNLQSAVWDFFPSNEEKCAALADSLQLPLPLARVLVNRGVDTVEGAQSFLYPDPGQLHSPFAMQDMEIAVKIIWEAIRERRKIAVYGDYDVDGVGATALLFMLLRKLGADVMYYIPHRLLDGYGLNRDVIGRLAEEQVSLLLTVDCGIGSNPEVAYARERGMDVVITDHHLPPLDLPPARAILNPLRPACSYPFKELCGAGIAFKLGQALLARQPGVKASKESKDPWLGMEEYLDLVTLATVADIVPLLGENRVLVSHGLRLMNKKPRPGVAALCQAANSGGSITAETISFILAPRLNAAGRLGDAARALKLLIAEQEEEARRLAAELHQENSRRQQLETDVLAEAQKMAEELPEDERDFLLLAAPRWPQGVIGIVASRLLEQYNRPVILVSLQEGEGKGSGRSSGAFNLTAALQQCAHLLLAYGGHQNAAGLTVKEENISALRRELNRLLRQWQEEAEPGPAFYVDAPLQPRDISAELVRGLEMLEPFGYGNPRPLFLGENWHLEGKKEVGQGQKHLQLSLSRDGFYFTAICFNGRNRLPEIYPLRELDLFFSLSFDRWRGGEALQLEIQAGRYADQYAGELLTLVDRRGLSRKDHYLKELAKREENCLVYVNTLERIRRLKSSFSSAQAISFTHQGRLKANEAPPKPLHLVLYDLPLQERQLKQLLQNLESGNNIKVHLLYGKRDWRENLRLLTATIPSLSVLEQVFWAVRELAAAGHSLSREEALRALKQCLPFPSTRHLLERCLLIFEQAACLQQEEGNIRLFPRQGDGGCYFLGSLKLSEDYKWARRKWQEALRWQKYLLEAGGKELFILLHEGAPLKLI